MKVLEIVELNYRHVILYEMLNNTVAMFHYAVTEP